MVMERSEDVSFLLVGLSVNTEASRREAPGTDWSSVLRGLSTIERAAFEVGRGLGEEGWNGAA
jgi:hypothetical protein